MSKLRELLSKATPGPWYKLHKSIGAGNYTKDGPDHRLLLIDDENGAELIVTLVNAAEEIADLMDAIKTYGDNHHGEVVVSFIALDKKLNGGGDK